MLGIVDCLQLMLKPRHDCVGSPPAECGDNRGFTWMKGRVLFGMMYALKLCLAGKVQNVLFECRCHLMVSGRVDFRSMNRVWKRAWTLWRL